MIVGICILDIEGRGRHIGIVRRDAHPNEGDLRSRVAKHLGVIAQDVRVHPLYSWDLSEGGGMCAVLDMKEIEHFIIGTFLERLSVRVTTDPKGVVLMLDDGTIVAETIGEPEIE